jgi:hypothetical protein
VGQEQDRVASPNASPGGSGDPDPLRRLEDRVDESRRRLDGYIAELDRRRHHATPLKIAGIAVISALAAGAAWLVASVLRSRLSGRSSRT